MPTTLPMTSRCRLPAAGQARALALDGREQVVDVVALEQPFAQRLERRALVRRRRLLPFDFAQGKLAVPARAQLLQLTLVLVALGVDGRPGFLEPRAQRVRIRSRLAQRANLVELLVQREDLLEQRRRYLRSAFFGFRRRQAFT